MTLAPPETLQNARALAVALDRSTQSVIRELLRANGYEPEGALSGTDAMRLLTERKYDAVVATIGAPPINGYGLWALMQGMKRLENVKFVLALSEKDLARLRKEGRELPSTLLIPFTADALRAALERSSTEAVEVFEI